MTTQEMTQLVEDTVQRVTGYPLEQSGDVLVLVPAHTCFPQAAQIEQLAGTGKVLLAGFGLQAPGKQPYWRLGDPGCVERLLDTLEQFTAVYLYCPGFALLGRLAQLQDEDVLVRILLQRLFLGKTAGICFGHSPSDAPPKLQAHLRELLEPVEALGFSVRYAGAPASGEPDALQGLLLEGDIAALHQQGHRQLRMGVGCILTPLAADKARELGMQILHQT